MDDIRPIAQAGLDPKRFTVQVPATSANMCVGYDCLGMAVNLGARFTFTDSDELLITGCPEKYRGPDNLVNQAYQEACKELGVIPGPYHVHIDTEVPASRGLGSSATCIVAGVVAAGIREGAPFTRQQVIAIATRIEGHPDNVAPAVMGSLVCSYIHPNGDAICSSFPVSPSRRFICLVPDYEVRTEDARKVVPQDISLQTGVWQMARCVAVCRAFEDDDLATLALSMDDRLHEPYRRQFIPQFQDVQAICDKHSAVLWISGSGSTMLMTADGDDIDSLYDELSSAYPGFQCRIIIADTEGVRAC